MSATVATLVGVIATLLVGAVTWLIAKHGWKREDRAASQEGQSAANLVRREMTNFGGLRVEIVNDAPMPITNVKLVDVHREDAGVGETWQVNPRVWGSTAVTPHIPPHGGRFKIPVDLLDENGQNLRSRQGDYVITFEWTDNDGARWKRINDAQPRRIRTTSP